MDIAHTVAACEAAQAQIGTPAVYAEPYCEALLADPRRPPPHEALHAFPYRPHPA